MDRRLSGELTAQQVERSSLDFRVNLTGRYEFDLGPSVRRFIQASVVTQDDVLFDIAQDPNTIQDGYTLVNASIGATIGDVVVTGFVRNLFDVSYATSIFGTPAVVPPIGYSHFIPRDAERYFGGMVEYRF